MGTVYDRSGVNYGWKGEGRAVEGRANTRQKVLDIASSLIAAGAIYAATGQTVTQAALAEAADVCPITIRSAFRSLEAGDE